MANTFDNGARVRFKSAADGDDFDLIISGHVGTVRRLAFDDYYGSAAFQVECETCGQSHCAMPEYVLPAVLVADPQREYPIAGAVPRGRVLRSYRYLLCLNYGRRDMRKYGPTFATKYSEVAFATVWQG